MTKYPPPAHIHPAALFQTCADLGVLYAERTKSIVAAEHFFSIMAPAFRAVAINAFRQTVEEN
jgi:hypothetical protein